MKEKMVWFNKLIVAVVGNSLSSHVGMKFSTIDVDNDESTDNCAAMRSGGWWYWGCYVFFLSFYYVFKYSHLTGQSV